jgi:sugar lactone lactonase YvrE
MRPHSIVLAGAIWLAAASFALAAPPTVGPATPFAGGIAGPEGLAFGNDGTLFVGTDAGDILRVASDGSTSLVASTGDSLAGIGVMRDGTILACAFGAYRVWAIDPVSGGASVYANVSSPNFVVQTKRGHVIVSSTFTGTIVDITNGANVVLASGFSFPNGLAIRKKYLYVADTALHSVQRLPFTTPGTLGPAEPYASGLTFADGIAFDRPGNLFVVGFDTLFVVDAKTQAVTTFSDALYDWPSNVAFGTSRLYGKTTMFLANYGPGLGDGTTVVKVPTNHTGARLIR